MQNKWFDSTVSNPVSHSLNSMKPYFKPWMHFYEYVCVIFLFNVRSHQGDLSQIKPIETKAIQYEEYYLSLVHVQG